MLPEQTCRRSRARFKLPRNSSSFDELDDGGLFHVPAEKAGVPICQPDAAVGFGLADFCRRRGAMNAITFRRQADPVGAHRIVGARFDREACRRLYALEFIVRII